MAGAGGEAPGAGEAVCRLCLRYAAPGGMSSLCDARLQLAARLRDLAPAAQILPDDGLPTTVCAECTAKVEAFHTFRKQIQNSYEILKSQFTGGVLNVFENPTIVRKSDEIETNNTDNAKTTHISFGNGLIEIDKMVDMKARRTQTTEDTIDEDFEMLEMYTKINEQDEIAPRIVEICAAAVQLADGSSFTPVKKYICLICLKQLVTEDVTIISAHAETHFSNTGMAQIGPNFFCELCSKIIINRHKFILHQRAHLKVKPFVCELCGSEFGCAAMLQDHAKIVDCHNKKLSPCEFCGMLFKRKCDLNSHLPTHFNKNKLECELCHKKISNEHLYKVHMKRHIVGKQFACDICPKSFYTQSHLKKHRLTHGNNRSHLCFMCGKSFLNGSDLTRHLDYHYRRRMHKCDYCKQTFYESSHLSSHIESKHGKKSPIPCEICGKIFLSISRLNKHIRNHPPVPDIKENFLNLDVGIEDKDEYISLESIEPSLDMAQIAADIRTSTAPADSGRVLITQLDDSERVLDGTENVTMEQEADNSVMLYILSGDTISYDTQGTSVV